MGSGSSGYSCSTGEGGEVTSRVSGPSAASAVADHPVVEAGARAGYLVNGVLHLLVAALGLQVAFGDKGAEADPKGAMRLVSDTPVGGLVLVAIVAGFVLLAVWQVSEGIRSRKAADRVKAVGKTLVYLVLAWGAVTILLGGGTSGPAQAKDATATVMSLPFGQALVGACGLAVIGVGAFHIHKGWTEGFRDDLETSPGRLLITVGRIGYVAKGVALMAAGGGLVAAAALHDPSRSRGLDGALRDLVALPFGQVLVALISIGFAAYGIYSFARARHAKV